LHLLASNVEKLGLPQNNLRISFEAVTRPKDSRRFESKIHLIAQQGTSIISDIDDTIKISEIRNKSTLLANTFKRPFQTVPGMAQFYRTLAQQEQTTFHYISASPWQLYQPLANFLKDNEFPSGSFHLRLFRKLMPKLPSNIPNKLPIFSFGMSLAKNKTLSAIKLSFKKRQNLFGRFFKK